ncbi:MAG TPA: site-specific DNA-methyltransferase [Ramlibacter sp.]
MRKQTQFGLVFESHQPEVSRLYDYPIKPGTLVARKADSGNELLRVLSVEGGNARCLAAALDDPTDADFQTIPTSRLVACRRFGDPIYPSLNIVDILENNGEKPWHILIEADNYHALQLLEYTHEGKVDVIYIDPPYNTGASDWKYNNDYVDEKDPWKHSKWLSFIEKRLLISRRLLKKDGVIVVTIDEHEVHHLTCLLEQTFRDAYIQMVTIVINPKGVTQGRFSRVEEYAVFCFFGDAPVTGRGDDLLSVNEQDVKRSKSVRWKGLLRSGTNARRTDRKNMFYPILVDPVNGAVVRAGDPLPFDTEPDFDLKIDGFPVAWPVRSDGSLGNWGLGASTFNVLSKKGYVSVGEYDAKRRTWGFSYLSKKIQKQIESGAIAITSFDDTRRRVTVAYADERERQIKTVWHRSAHDAGAYGSDLLRQIFGEGGKFPFPKSVYAVRDTLAALLRHKKDAVVLDYFGGSGTTLHALFLLNVADGGHRQGILVTNNEVSKEEATSLRERGKQPGDIEWERNGICQAITWPRLKAAVTGVKVDGTPLLGGYETGEFVEIDMPPEVRQVGIAEGKDLDSGARSELAKLIGRGISTSPSAPDYDIDLGKGVTILWDVEAIHQWLDALDDEDGIRAAYIVTKQKSKFRAAASSLLETLPRLVREVPVTCKASDGFDENVAYVRLGFLDPDTLSRGRSLEKILPVLWMHAGGKSSPLQADKVKAWIMSPENSLAILCEEDNFQDFLPEVVHLGIKDIFLVTDSLDSFNEMNSQLPSTCTINMLYSSYLTNFRINSARTP